MDARIPSNLLLRLPEISLGELRNTPTAIEIPKGKASNREDISSGRITATAMAAARLNSGLLENSAIDRKDGRIEDNF